MNDTDTATIKLSRGEAREVINALSEYRFKTSGSEEQRALNVREFLQREFEFEERHLDNDDGLLDSFASIFADEEGTHEVQLSRAEAGEVIPALAGVEGDMDPAEAETVADLRDRFERTFDLNRP